MEFVLTRETIEKARAYLPLAEKEKFVSENAPKCFDRLQITNGDEQMPPMWKENPALKARYLMYALTSLYLGLSVDADDGLLKEAEYDRFAGSHVFMQIERIKRDKSVSDKVYDLFSDFKLLERWFSGEIDGLLAVQNDGVVRQAQMTSEAMKELPALLQQIQALQEKKAGD